MKMLATSEITATQEIQENYSKNNKETNEYKNPISRTIIPSLLLSIFLTISFILFVIYLLHKKILKTNSLYEHDKKANLIYRKHYDYLLVGAGLFNAVLAEHFLRNGKTVLVLERRDHIAGNCFTENKYDIDIHVYGPHIFHTSNKEVWKYINKFGEFKQTSFSPLANYDEKFEEQAISMLGRTIYKKLIKEYTEKQWERDCKELNPSIIKRLSF